MSLQARLTSLISAIGQRSKENREDIYPLGGQFLLDPNEFNGWGNNGPIDNSNTQDLGNVAVANPNRNAGGISFPWDVDLLGFFAWHRNSNGAAEAWGWRIGMQTKNAGSNTVSWVDVISEVADNGGVGPRNYSNNQNQQTSIDLSVLTNNVLTAGDVLVLGVEAPTANTTNYFVQIHSGYLHFRRRI